MRNIHSPESIKSLSEKISENMSAIKKVLWTTFVSAMLIVSPITQANDCTCLFQWDGVQNQKPKTLEVYKSLSDADKRLLNGAFEMHGGYSEEIVQWYVKYWEKWELLRAKSLEENIEEYNLDAFLLLLSCFNEYGIRFTVLWESLGNAEWFEDMNNFLHSARGSRGDEDFCWFFSIVLRFWSRVKCLLFFIYVSSCFRKVKIL